MPEPDQDKPQKRKRTPPSQIKVENLALDKEDQRHVNVAVRDLKELGFWKPLTRYVVGVKIATRAGSERIPDDGHLADAYRSVQLEPTPGYVCDIFIFSQALTDDVLRQQDYYNQGLLSDTPPTLRQFWAVILGHEMAHCSPRGQKGEKYSTMWEKRVLNAFETSRLGTPE